MELKIVGKDSTTSTPETRPPEHQAMDTQLSFRGANIYQSIIPLDLSCPEQVATVDEYVAALENEPNNGTYISRSNVLIQTWRTISRATTRISELAERCDRLSQELATKQKTGQDLGSRLAEEMQQNALYAQELSEMQDKLKAANKRASVAERISSCFQQMVLIRAGQVGGTQQHYPEFESPLQPVQGNGDTSLPERNNPRLKLRPRRRDFNLLKLETVPEEVVELTPSLASPVHSSRAPDRSPVVSNASFNSVPPAAARTRRFHRTSTQLDFPAASSWHIDIEQATGRTPISRCSVYLRRIATATVVLVCIFIGIMLANEDVRSTLVIAKHRFEL